MKSWKMARRIAGAKKYAPRGHFRLQKDQIGPHVQDWDDIKDLLDILAEDDLQCRICADWL
jgi:hypothetical protein